MINPAAWSLVISLPIALLLSSEKHWRGCLTGFEPGRMCNLCSPSSLGTPGMSCGDHAKMSRFSRRNSMSSLSYLSQVRLRPQRTWLSRRDLEQLSYYLWPTEKPTLHLISSLGRLEGELCSALAPLQSPCRADASLLRSLGNRPNCRQPTCIRGTS